MSLPLKTYGTKTHSVYGGAGGQGTRVSSSRPALFCGSSWQSNRADGLTLDISDNQKAIMQNLNDRLASFIQKVQSLNGKKAELERNINEWCASHTVVSNEYSGFLATIERLQDQVRLEEEKKGRRDHIEWLQRYNVTWALNLTNVSLTLHILAIYLSKEEKKYA